MAILFFFFISHWDTFPNTQLFIISHWNYYLFYFFLQL